MKNNRLLRTLQKTVSEDEIFKLSNHTLPHISEFNRSVILEMLQDELLTQEEISEEKITALKNTLENYLDNYDMGRSEEFGYDTVYKQDGIHQDFHRCVFAKTWMEAGEEKYGRIYCENIDPAIAEGYNENMECVHDHIMYADGHCTFCFRMKENNKK